MKVRDSYKTQKSNNPPVFLLKACLYQYIKPGATLNCIDYSAIPLKKNQSGHVLTIAI